MNIFLSDLLIKVTKRGYRIISNKTILLFLGPGDQGILFEHREGTFGDNVNVTQVRNYLYSWHNLDFLEVYYITYNLCLFLIFPIDFEWFLRFCKIYPEIIVLALPMKFYLFRCLKPSKKWKSDSNNNHQFQTRRWIRTHEQRMMTVT